MFSISIITRGLISQYHAITVVITTNDAYSRDIHPAYVRRSVWVLGNCVPTHCQCSYPTSTERTEIGVPTSTHMDHVHKVAGSEGYDIFIQNNEIGTFLTFKPKRMACESQGREHRLEVLCIRTYVW